MAKATKIMKKFNNIFEFAAEEDNSLEGQLV
jgi:hypothetical protein